MPEAQTCSIEGLGQLRHPIPQMLIMVLRSIWRGSFATPPRCQCRYRSVPKARTCSIEGLGRLRHPIPQVLIMVLRSIWRGSFATPPRCQCRYRSVPKARTCSIEGLGQLRHPIPNLGNNHPPFVRQWSRCIWGAVLRTSPRCTTMRGLQVRARGTDL